MFELLVALLVWAIVHSLTAGASTKEWYRQTFGERAYQGTFRLAYNVLSGLTLLPILYLLLTRVPDRLLWSVPMPYRLINYVVLLAGAAGFLVALWQTDIWRFVGLRQMARYVAGEADPELPPPFIATGVYRFVRHPLYFFSMLFLWANPVMSLTAFIITLWVTLYFYIGSYYEERRLLAEFGEAYRQYQIRVPRMIPLPFRSDHSSTIGK